MRQIAVAVAGMVEVEQVEKHDANPPVVRNQRRLIGAAAPVTFFKNSRGRRA